MDRVLVIGYGNPGRLDDGLGVAFAEAIEARALDGVTVESDYQLTVEDAEAAARHDAVVFVDAALDGPAPFRFESVAAEPERSPGFTSHHLDPAAVLALARDLFGAAVPGYVLGIRGYAFDEFGEALSPGAQANLAASLEFLSTVLGERRLAAAAAEAARARPSGSESAVRRNSRTIANGKPSGARAGLSQEG
jgi:hydrogenase maturation protease